MEKLVKEIKSTKATPRIKSNVMHTLAALSNVQGKMMGPEFDRLLPVFEEIMKDKQSYDLILDTLIIMRRLFKKEEHATYKVNHKRILDIIT